MTFSGTSRRRALKLGLAAALAAPAVARAQAWPEVVAAADVRIA
jgi:hypothetical protein